MHLRNTLTQIHEASQIKIAKVGESSLAIFVERI